MSEEEIGLLAEKVLLIEESPENRKKKKLWQNEESKFSVLHYHEEPKVNAFPFTVGLELQFWANIFGFDIEEFYTSPTAYFKWMLKMMLYQYENFKDDTPVSKNIYLYFGAGIEASFFGLKQVFKPGTEPWAGREPLIKKKSDLVFMKMPDFYNTGSMPRIHNFYEEIRLLAERSGFNVIFPQFNRGPFGVALLLRGFENLFVDIKEDPAFVHDLMRFVVDVRKNWTKERANFLGVKIEKGDLRNDEIDSTLMSPELYEEFILPYEKELCDFHGGIRYWHSCAKIDELLNSVLKIPSIDLLDVGPWTDLETALKLTQGKIPIEVRLHPQKLNVYSATEQEMRKNIREITEACLKYNNRSFVIRAGGLQRFTTVSRGLSKIKLWARVAREELHQIAFHKTKDLEENF